DRCAFAHRLLALADLHTEEPGVSSRAGAAFSALIDVLRSPHIHAAVIPVTGAFLPLRRHVPGNVHRDRDETGVDVLIMSGSGRGGQ
ncbi:MAG: hypothetical protein ACRDTJ_00555, partial [Pseudonocardiaceae bacterium]